MIAPIGFNTHNHHSQQSFRPLPGNIECSNSVYNNNLTQTIISWPYVELVCMLTYNYDVQHLNQFRLTHWSPQMWKIKDRLFSISVPKSFLNPPPGKPGNSRYCHNPTNPSPVGSDKPIGQSKHIQATRKLKGVANKTWTFKFYNFGLRCLKENDRYPFVLLKIWKFWMSSYYPGFYSSLSDNK